jgi:hypothetical protein
MQQDRGRNIVALRSGEARESFLQDDLASALGVAPRVRAVAKIVQTTGRLQQRPVAGRSADQLAGRVEQLQRECSDLVRMKILVRMFGAQVRDRRSGR